MLEDNYSKRMMSEYIKKKIFTTGIGAIDDIERILKDEISIDEELWEKIRKAILDRTNYQYRLVQEELNSLSTKLNNTVTLIGIMKENKDENRRN